jgi:phosphatidylglycerol:prolipoprotein diacylglycerol transferase
MSFPDGISPTLPGVRVYPTPLLELAAGLLIGWWLWRQLGKPHAVGAIVGQYLALSGTARFLVEFIRRNPKVLWGLSNAQLASAGSVVAGVALIVWSATRRDSVTENTSAGLEKPA